MYSPDIAVAVVVAQAVVVLAKPRDILDTFKCTMWFIRTSDLKVGSGKVKLYIYIIKKKWNKYGYKTYVALLVLGYWLVTYICGWYCGESGCWSYGRWRWCDRVLVFDRLCDELGVVFCWAACFTWSRTVPSTLNKTYTQMFKQKSLKLWN